MPLDYRVDYQNPECRPDEDDEQDRRYFRMSGAAKEQAKMHNGLCQHGPDCAKVRKLATPKQDSQQRREVEA